MSRIAIIDPTESAAAALSQPFRAQGWEVRHIIGLEDVSDAEGVPDAVVLVADAASVGAPGVAVAI